MEKFCWDSEFGGDDDDDDDDQYFVKLIP